MPAKTKYARSGDILIAYQVTGEGPTDIVFAPGLVSHLDLDWEFPLRAQFFNALGQFCRVIRFDKRGTGLSDRPTHMATLEQRSEDIRAVMDAERLESAHLFGSSEGGSMVCLFAGLYPERVKSLLVWGTQARWVWSPDHPWGQSAEQYAQTIQSIRDEWGSEAYVRGVGAGLGPNAPSSFVDLTARYMRAAASPTAAAAYEAMNSDIDIRGILGAVRAPTLVMHRTDDPSSQIQAARDLARRIPHARFREYPGESHSLMLGDMTEIISDIQLFITGERSVDAQDRRLAAILFLDIDGSTEHAVRLGDQAWSLLLGTYYTLARKNFTRYRGEEMTVAGDGFLAVFDGPARAIRCALSLATAVGQLGITIRASVHVGECEFVAENVAGQAVHAGARIMAFAGPGDILVSAVVRDLVAGAGLQFVDRGSHRLKGLPGRMRLWQALLNA